MMRIDITSLMKKIPEESGFQESRTSSTYWTCFTLNLPRFKGAVPKHTITVHICHYSCSFFKERFSFCINYLKLGFHPKMLYVDSRKKFSFCRMNISVVKEEEEGEATPDQQRLYTEIKNENKIAHFLPSCFS